MTGHLEKRSKSSWRIVIERGHDPTGALDPRTQAPDKYRRLACGPPRGRRRTG